jgi:hypothetical protein
MYGKPALKFDKFIFDVKNRHSSRRHAIRCVIRQSSNLSIRIMVQQTLTCITNIFTAFSDKFREDVRTRPNKHEKI